MSTRSAHRIIEASPGLKTLILCGPRRGGWGFYREGRYVPWQEYVHSYERATAADEDAIRARTGEWDVGPRPAGDSVIVPSSERPKEESDGG